MGPNLVRPMHPTPAITPPPQCILEPPDPPDAQTEMEEDPPVKQSFKEILMDKNKELNENYIDFLNEASIPDDVDPNDSIIFSNEDKTRIYMPWKHSVSIKMAGEKVSHQYLKKRLNELWKPTESMILIDLGWDFFIANFKLLENMQKALQEGPWFILGIFLSEPKFVPLESTISHNAIWTRLPQLPMELYDRTILKKIDRKLGALLKIDTCISAALRRRYARICIQIPIGVPVKIGNHIQEILYEGTSYTW
ncbi:hypothetical protein RDI58_002947 [Solanum bulbocastanum]|uniref:DUF4283 domain-containing protein n=1 Tax=Solanum bulbocastanum TaxID=147425 RepID=A0AAN8U516_SOLBU